MSRRINFIDILIYKFFAPIPHKILNILFLDDIGDRYQLSYQYNCRPLECINHHCELLQRFLSPQSLSINCKCILLQSEYRFIANYTATLLIGNF